MMPWKVQRRDHLARFHSYPHLHAWLDEVPHEHTVHDDLESFLWVLVLEYRSAADRYGALSRHPKYMLGLLKSFAPLDVSLGRGAIIPEEYLRSLFPLFRDWLALVRNTTLSVDELYGQFFQTGYTYLENAPKAWDSWENLFDTTSDEAMSIDWHKQFSANVIDRPKTKQCIRIAHQQIVVVPRIQRSTPREEWAYNCPPSTTAIHSLWDPTMSLTRQDVYLGLINSHVD